MSVTSVKAAERNLTKGGDIKEEMALVMAPYANWEQFLVPAPLSISILGELMGISTQKDFSLEAKPPQNGFKLIKYPGSFRACLVQVSNEGWSAFNLAHKNMDQIRLYSGNVPGNLKKAVEVLLKGEKEDIEDVLPVELGAIQNTAESCLKLATAVEAKFDGVMDLTGELLEACTNAKGTYEEQLREKEIQQRVAKEREAAIQEEKKNAEESFKLMKESVSRAEDTFKQTLDSMPSGWDLVGMQVVEGLATACTSLIGAVAMGPAGAMGAKVLSDVNQGGQAVKHGKKIAGVQAQMSNVLPKMAKTYAKVIEMQPYVKMLFSTYLEGNTLNKAALADKADEKMLVVKTNLEHIMTDVSKLESSETSEAVIGYCKRGIDICAELKNIRGNWHGNKKQGEDVAKKITALNSDVMGLGMEAKVSLGNSASDMILPNQAVSNTGSEEQGSQGTSAANLAVQNARYKTEAASNHLKNTQEQYTKSCDRLKESTYELANIMGEIAKLDMQRIDFEKIKEILQQGIRALAKLRKQWTKLVRFFTMMSNIIKCCLVTSLENFLDHSQSTSQRRLAIGNYTISKYRKDLIYSQAFEAAKIAYLVNMIAGSYMEVSNMYIMDRIAGLAGILGYDPVKEAHKIQQEMKKLADGCEEAQEGICRIVQRNKSDFDAKIKKRLQKITDMQDSLPPPEANEKAAIESAKAKANVEIKKMNVAGTAELDTSDFV